MNTVVWLSVFVILRLLFSYVQEVLASNLGHTVKSALRKEASCPCVQVRRAAW